MSVTGLSSDQLVIGTANGVGIYVADSLTTPAPTDTATDWGTGWVPLGYASDDGPTISSSTDTTDITAWQALGSLRSVITGRTITVQFQLMQWSAVNVALYWDIDTPTFDNTTGAYSFSVRSDQAGRRRQIGVDVKDGANIVRIIFPRVQLNAAGDLQFQRSAAAVLDVTFAALETDGVLLKQVGILPPVAAPISAPLTAPVSASSGD